MFRAHLTGLLPVLLLGGILCKYQLSKLTDTVLVSFHLADFMTFILLIIERKCWFWRYHYRFHCFILLKNIFLDWISLCSTGWHETHYVAQAGLTLGMCLLQLPECWNYGFTLLFPAIFTCAWCSIRFCFIYFDILVLLAHKFKIAIPSY
jgi:hypothetical protein